ATLRAYRYQKAVLALAVVLSIGLQLIIVIQSVLLATALGLQISMWELALIVPVVTLVSMLPVTINGLGLREDAFAVLGASIGISAADAVALGWLTVAGALIYGIWGATLHLRGRGRREAVEESS
ncbi:MAG: lysylphosphatidylglycerol synthase domain-containing protein, partial [Thermoanaerobaculia bacterium]